MADLETKLQFFVHRVTSLLLLLTQTDLKEALAITI